MLLTRPTTTMPKPRSRALRLALMILAPLLALQRLVPQTTWRLCLVRLVSPAVGSICLLVLSLCLRLQVHWQNRQR